MTDEKALHLLTSAVIELEAHVNDDGWDQPARLFAMARLGDLFATEPALAKAMGLHPDAAPQELIPVEQEWAAGDEAIDEALAQITWPPQVIGVALAIERLLLPPSAEHDLEDAAEEEEVLRRALDHPDRREVRLTAAVMRDGRKMCAIRLRENDTDDEVLSGPDLIPNLTSALATTLT